MTSNRKHANWPLWLWQNGFVLFSLVGLLALVSVTVVSWNLNERLDALGAQASREPARRHTPPDLDDYAASEPVAAAIAVEKLVYVPVYSHAYYDSGRPYLLETTLSIRNTDLHAPLYVRSVAYYDTNGELVKTPVDRLIRLKPLETIEFLVEARDTSGGSGANFIVDWLATERINEPVVEAVMVGAAGPHGIGFLTTGRTIDEHPADGASVP